MKRSTNNKGSASPRCEFLGSRVHDGRGIEKEGGIGAPRDMPRRGHVARQPPAVRPCRAMPPACRLRARRTSDVVCDVAVVRVGLLQLVLVHCADPWQGSGGARPHEVRRAQARSRASACALRHPRQACACGRDALQLKLHTWPGHACAMRARCVRVPNRAASILSDVAAKVRARLAGQSGNPTHWRGERGGADRP